MPVHDHVLQMTDITNTVIGHVNSPKELSAKAEGYRDGDTLTNLEFTNIQVGGATCDNDHESKDQGVSFAEAERKVQGVRGTNQLKVKKKIKTTSKTSDANHLPGIRRLSRVV